MNLKERGITVGDLLIIFIIIVATTVVIKKFNNQEQSMMNQIEPEISRLKLI